MREAGIAEVARAAAKGLLLSWGVVECAKVFALWVTGPYLLLRLPRGRPRKVVRFLSKVVHKPLQAIM